jgi:hypothetical protein
VTSSAEVGSSAIRMSGQHHGDHRPLAHAAGELVGIGGVDSFRIADAHGCQHFQAALPRLRLRHAAIGAIGLGDLAADGHHGIEREFRILHHHGDALAADAAHLPVAGAQQVGALEVELARGHLAR